MHCLFIATSLLPHNHHHHHQLPLPSPLQIMFHIRAAFDIGSSQHKLTVAQVSPYSKPHVLHQAAIRVPLADSLTPHNYLPPHILSASHAALRTLKAAALTHGATQFAAIATHVFRVATNGPQHLASLSNTHNMSVTLITSTEEGLLAFSTASLNVVDLSRVIVWDSGGASSQWTHHHAHRYHVHSVALGSGNVRAAYRRLRCVRKLANWISALAITHLDPILLEKARSGVVIAIGGPTSMFALARIRLGKQSFAEHEVRQLLPQINHQDDHDVFSVLPKLILLAELMKCYHISSVRYIPSNGNCLGLLLSRDSRFWGPSNLSDQNWPSLVEGLILKGQSTYC